MRRDELNELHYITPVENIPSVMKNGILSYKNAAGVQHQSCANEDVQERREHVVVPGGGPLHRYVNLYFHARNPMMYVIQDKHKSLCVLALSSNVLDLPGVVISDCNAARDYVLFKPAATGLAMIDRDLVYAEFWTHENPVEQYHHTGLKCAEILVPERVDSHFIRKAYVSNEETKGTLSDLLARNALTLDVVVNGHLFFR